MITILKVIMNCITGAEPSNVTTCNEKAALLGPCPPRNAEEIADQVFRAMLNADKGGTTLQLTLNNIVGEYGWTEEVAQWVLAKTEQALREV